MVASNRILGSLPLFCTVDANLWTLADRSTLGTCRFGIHWAVRTLLYVFHMSPGKAVHSSPRFDEMR